MAHPVPRRGAFLDLLLAKSWLREGCGPGCDDSEILELKIPRDASSRIKTSELRTTDLNLFREPNGRIPWENALKGE